MNEQEFMQFIQEFPEVVPYLEEDEGLMADIILDPNFREEVKQTVYTMRGEEPPAPQQPAPQQPAPQYQYANYDSGGKFLGYTSGESGKSNAMSNSAYVVAPNGQKYNTNNAPQQNYKSDYNNTNSQSPKYVMDTNYKELYKNSDLLEKQFQEQGLYNLSDITNPYHYAHTGDVFGEGIASNLLKQGYQGTGGYKLSGTNELTGQKFLHPEGQKFVYVDKYGQTAVTADFARALANSKDGNIKEYGGETKYGYATNDKGGRLYFASMEGSSPFDGYNEGTTTDNSYIDGYGNRREVISANTPDSTTDMRLNPFDVQRLLKQSPVYNTGMQPQAGSRQERNSAYSPPQHKPQTYQYENFDASGKSMGFTTGTNGRSNYMQGAVSVKAPNGKSYSTGYQPPANNPATTVKSQPALNFKADFNNFKSGVRDIVYGNSSKDKAKSPAVVTANPATTPKPSTTTTAKITSGGVVNKNTGSSAGGRIVNSLKDKLLASLRKGK